MLHDISTLVVLYSSQSQQHCSPLKMSYRSTVLRASRKCTEKVCSAVLYTSPCSFIRSRGTRATDFDTEQPLNCTVSHLQCRPGVLELQAAKTVDSIPSTKLLLQEGCWHGSPPPGIPSP